MDSKARESKDVTELWGTPFNIVKSGLSQAQVISFVESLQSQRDILVERQEHLAALEKLAETKVAEADKLVGEMKQEAKSEAEKITADAEARASQIINGAQLKGSQILEQRGSEAAALANKQAEEILSKARAEAEAMLESEKSKIQPQLAGFTKDFFGRLMSEVSVMIDQSKTLEQSFGREAGIDRQS